ncbi:MAG: DNA polymerase III subunit delta [Spirochaetota bacterium]
MTQKALKVSDLQLAIQKELSHIYCFCGNDENQKEEALTLIASRLWKNSKPHDYKITTYFAEDALEQALAAIASVSLFDDTALYIIKHCEQVSASKKIHTMVLDCINNLPNCAYVIFDTQENKLPSLLPSHIHTHIPVIQFYRPFEENCKSYILKKCKALSLTISQEATELLVELTASNIKEIDDILTTISFSGHTDISKDFLEGFVINEREAIEFEFVDCFFLKDKRAWDLLSEAIERNVSQILLVSLLFNHAQKLEQFHVQTAKGVHFDSLMKELKIYGKRQKMFAKQVSIYTLDNVRKLIAMLYTYDIQLKSYHSDGFFKENPLLDLLLQFSL